MPLSATSLDASLEVPVVKLKLIVDKDEGARNRVNPHGCEKCHPDGIKHPHALQRIPFSKSMDIIAGAGDVEKNRIPVKITDFNLFNIISYLLINFVIIYIL